MVFLQVSIQLDDITVQKRFLVSLRSRLPFDINSKILTINVSIFFFGVTSMFEWIQI